MKNNFLKMSLIYLPSPSNLVYFWNFGFFLGIWLMIQIITGVFLSFHYCASLELAFESLQYIMREVNWGWIIQLMHMNGASLFFVLLYLHMGRGMYYLSYFIWRVWYSGVLIFLLVMLSAFLGYVLPWGQMSFWGATVITSLLTSLPYLGEMMVNWVWGGFSVGNSTLNRFYSFHFLLPLVVAVLAMIHMILLHETGSSNPMGCNSDKDKIEFYPYFLFKDLFFFTFIVGMVMFLIMMFPFKMSDPDNFSLANPLVTPIHIQPEWYFLFAYAILRSIPNKLMGVIALVLSILILLILPLKSSRESGKFSWTYKIMFWSLMVTFFMLTWLGSCPVEEPFIKMGQGFSLLYFFFYFMMVIF